MIAVDTNLPVYAHREDSPWHEAAYSRIAELAEGRAVWAIPWLWLHEFLAVEELWSADRDFSRFPGLAVRNPLVQ